MNRSLESVENITMEAGEGEASEQHQENDDHHPAAAAGRPASRHGGELYVTVSNPAVSSANVQDYTPTTTTTTNWSRVWIQVLLVLVVALLIDVIVLTVHTVQDESNNSSSSADAWKPLPPSTQVLTKVVFGSCAHQKMPQPYWDTLLQYDPDVVVLMGDNVYGDCSSDADEACTTLREAYSDFAQLPSFIGAKQSLPIVATLDDHDYGKNDADGTNPHKSLAKQLFLDFFGIPANDERRLRENDGVYTSYAWGIPKQRIQLILLDNRFHRSPFLPTDEPLAPGKERYIPDYQNTSKRMLSDTQWDWLEQQLNQPDFDLRLVVSSIQVLADGTGFDCWRMLPHERDRLVELLLEANSPDNTNPALTLLLSGDRHVGGYYEYNGLAEITASSWTHTMPYGMFDNCTDAATCDEVDERRIGDFVRDNHFGSVEVNWENRTVTVALRRAQTSEHFKSFDDNLTDAGEILRVHQYNLP